MFVMLSVKILLALFMLVCIFYFLGLCAYTVKDMSADGTNGFLSLSFVYTWKWEIGKIV